jgi:hypothetical protein
MMAHFILNDEELIRRLNKHPNLRARFESILSAVEDESGDLKLADDAEMRMIDEVRRMGHEALQAWAERQTSQCSQLVGQADATWREGKKN